MRHAKRTHIAALATVFLCAHVLVPAAASAQTRIGVVLPLSGDHESLGRAALDGLDWGRETARDRYGVDIELELHDSRGDADIATQRVEALAGRDDIAAVIGPMGMHTSTKAAVPAARSRLPLLTLTSAEGIEGAGASVFRLRLSPEAQSRALARFALSVLELERAAVFYPDNAYGEGCMRAFVEAYSDAGGAITAIEGFDPEETRPKRAAELLTGHRARRLRSGDGPARTRGRKRSSAHVDYDVLFIPATGDTVSRVLAFLKLADMKFDGRVQLLGTSTWAAGGLAGTEGLASGALVAQLFDGEMNERIRARTDAFVTSFDRRPTDLEAQAHDGVLLLARALQRCGAQPQRACIVQSLRSGARIEGVTGAVALKRDGWLSREVLLFDVDHTGTLLPSY